MTLDTPTAAATTTNAVSGTLPGIFLFVDRFCQHNSITTVQDAVTNIIDREFEFKMKEMGVVHDYRTTTSSFSLNSKDLFFGSQ